MLNHWRLFSEVAQETLSINQPFPPTPQNHLQVFPGDNRKWLEGWRCKERISDRSAPFSTGAKSETQLGRVSLEFQFLSQRCPSTVRSISQQVAMFG